MTQNFRIEHVHALKSGAASEALERQISLPPQRFDELLRQGAIWADGQRLQEDKVIPAGAYLRVHVDPRRFPADQVDWMKTLFHEDSEFLIVNKPAGIPVHATVDNATENVLYQLEQLLRHPVFVTQRLDIPTYGLFVVAKTKWFQSKFNGRLRDRSVNKNYLALTNVPVPVGRHIHHMEDSLKAPRSVTLQEQPGSSICDLEVLECRQTGDGYLSKIALFTGRTHQIRAQLKFLGAPLVGDQCYGNLSPDPWNKTGLPELESIGLCSYRLEFDHPGRVGDAAQRLFLLSKDPGGTVIS